MNSTDAGTGEHRHDCLGDHRHVDGDPITLLDASIFEGVGKAVYIGMQFTVGDLFVLGGVVTLPEDGGLVATTFKMAVQTVVGDIQFATLEPFDMQIIFAKAPVQRFVPGFEPGEILFRLF